MRHGLKKPKDSDAEDSSASSSLCASDSSSASTPATPGRTDRTSEHVIQSFYFLLIEYDTEWKDSLVSILVAF